MKALLSYIGYDESLESKNKITYIINLVSMLLVLLYLTFFVFYVKSTMVTVVTLICLTIFVAVFVSLKKKHYLLSKSLMILGFLFQEFALVFLWFSKETHFNYFFFIVAPITFFIYDFSIKKERNMIITFNTIAIILLFLSEVFTFSEPIINISPLLIRFFSGLSVISTIGSITIVYYLYASTLSKTHKELRLLANTDGLTQILNRRALFSLGGDLFTASKNNNRGFSLIIFDIDFFKAVNDAYGHPVGDLVLIEMTKLVTSIIRKTDAFSRYGGEEFAIILKDTPFDEHLLVANQLNKHIEEHRFCADKGLNIKVTVSIGVVDFKKSHPNFEAMVKQADQALYQAKENGRNRVVVSA